MFPDRVVVDIPPAYDNANGAIHTVEVCCDLGERRELNGLVLSAEQGFGGLPADCPEFVRDLVAHASDPHLSVREICFMPRRIVLELYRGKSPVQLAKTIQAALEPRVVCEMMAA